MKFTRSIVLISLLAFSGAAVAQTTAPAPAAPAAPSAPAMPKADTGKMQKPRSAKSMECSKQADSQSLHGKPRHAFMSKCKKS